MMLEEAGAPRNSMRERQETKQGPCLRAQRKQQEDRCEWRKLTEPGAGTPHGLQRLRRQVGSRAAEPEA